MLDQMSGRLWADHHNEFSLSVGRGFARLSKGLGQLASRDGTTPQLLAILTALLVTSLGFTTTASA